jgi:hypothetical protein
LCPELRIDVEGMIGTSCHPGATSALTTINRCAATSHAMISAPPDLLPAMRGATAGLSHVRSGSRRQRGDESGLPD